MILSIEYRYFDGIGKLFFIGEQILLRSIKLSINNSEYKFSGYCWLINLN